MRRVYLSLQYIFGPIAALSLFLGPFGLMYVAVMALLVVLVFHALRLLERLGWWHVVIAGALVTTPAALPFIEIVFLWLGAGSFLDNTPAELSASAVFGVLVSSLFWWMAIFRNDTFQFVSRKPPVLMLLTIPVVGALVHYSIATHAKPGPFACVKAQHMRELPKKGHWRSDLDVRLEDGQRVALIVDESFTKTDFVGRCYQLSQRPPADLRGVRYSYWGSRKEVPCETLCDATT